MSRAATLAIAVMPLLSIPVSAQTELGPVQARSQEPFSRIVGLRELASGAVLVADAGDLRILTLSADLRSSRTSSRQGQGPLEFGGAFALVPYRGDTTLMADPSNQRIAAFDGSGALVRTFHLTTTSAGFVSTPLARFGDGQGAIYFQGTRASLLDRASRASSDSAAVLKMSVESGAVDTIAWVRVPVAATSATPNQGGVQMSRALPDPFAPRDGWAVATNGRVAIVRAMPYRVEWVGHDGRVVTGAPIAVTPVRVTDADRAAATRPRDTTRQTFGAVTGGAPPSSGSSSVPTASGATVKPPFLQDAVRVDPAGRVWVARSRAAGDPIARYDVFDGAGHRVAEITILGNGAVVGFGAGTVYVATPDADDLLWLTRHALP